ncbi:MAG: META domain-containing protein [Bacteroides sp.]|nr:META domain-containing protein [Bacteroides sp.]
MKITNIHISLILLAMLPFGACNTVDRTAQKSKGSVGKDVQKEAVLPTDREKIVKPVSAVYTSEDLAKGIVKGDWAIETVNGIKTIGEIAPFIKFVPDQKRVYGNNGCNVINATYNYNPADSTIDFSNFLSTMRACDTEGITDTEINMALADAKYYTWRLNEDHYYLTLYNEDRTPVMELMHQNFQFLNGTWLVKEIDGLPMNVPNMKLVIDVDEGKLHGNTGCNIINGKLDTDMDAANSISFQSIGMTRKACPDANYETQLVMALEEAMRAKPLKEGRVALIDSQEKVVLLLERTSDK